MSLRYSFNSNCYWVGKPAPAYSRISAQQFPGFLPEHMNVAQATAQRKTEDHLLVKVLVFVTVYVIARTLL